MGLTGLRYLFLFIVLLLSKGSYAQDSFYKKVINNKSEFMEMANYILEQNYHKNFSMLHYYIEIDTLKDKKLVKFCKKFNISEILCTGVNVNKHQFTPDDSTIIFKHKYTPIFGSQKDIIIDCSIEKREYPNHPPSYGWELIRIDQGMYFYKH